MKQEIKIEKFIYGGDYNPEQWLDMPEILKTDIEYFKKAGINEVTMGVFSWAVLEPEEGVYNFGWLKERIDAMYENGISVILATPSGARPRWMSEKYPQVLRVDESRHRNLFGVRHNHCYTSPVYREKIRQMNTKLVEQFGGHPAILAWHLSNESGGECHCPLCQQAFQDWLEQKYGSIDKLNQAWYTTFWSHNYQSFSQVESPSSRGDDTLHALNLDWKRFVTDQTVDFIREEAKAIRDAGSALPTLVNHMYDYMGLNYHKFADVVDIISWDSYPFWHKEAEWETAAAIGMQHDIMRSMLKKPFLLMESSPSATNWEPVSKLRKPGMLKAASLQAIAHGSDSVQYFQMRKSRGSFEKFHGAVIDHYGGDDTRVFSEVTELGHILEQLGEIKGSQVESLAAVIFDWENRWAMEDAAGPRNKNLFYKETVEKSYRAFRKMGLNVDVIDMEQSLDDYKIVAAPMIYMLRAGFETKAEQFVKNGGCLILTYWSGIVNDIDLCYLGGTPHGFMEICGLRSTEIDALHDDESNIGITAAGGVLTGTYECKNLCEIVKVSTAKELLTYGEDFYAGSPALTKNTYGQGTAYYIGADFEQKLYDVLYRSIITDMEIELCMEQIPDNIEVNIRKSADAEYLFVQNFSREKIEIKLPLETYEILYGVYDGSILGLDTVILKK